MAYQEVSYDRNFIFWSRVCGDEDWDGIIEGTVIQTMDDGRDIDGPLLIYGDNMSVIHNTQQP